MIAHEESHEESMNDIVRRRINVRAAFIALDLVIWTMVFFI